MAFSNLPNPQNPSYRPCSWVPGGVEWLDKLALISQWAGGGYHHPCPGPLYTEGYHESV